MFSRGFTGAGIAVGGRAVGANAAGLVHMEGVTANRIERGQGEDLGGKAGLLYEVI